MNSLVLMPRGRGLHYARVSTACPAEIAERGSTTSLSTLLRGQWSLDVSSVDLVVIRSLFGGREFPAPALVNPESLDRLRRLEARMPLHASGTRDLVEEAGRLFPQAEVALAFETSFFAELPAREIAYALPGEAALGARRWGYHGLFHAAAVDYALSTLDPTDVPPRILSICLEPRSEVAAVRGRSPIMVTGGSTPVEGLPGEFSCGEIDPAIALALAADPEVGPERANVILTRESGMRGLVGKAVPLDEVLRGGSARLRKAKAVFLHRLVLAAGSALASLEGLDAVVCSGRYTDAADEVVGELVPRLERLLDRPKGSLPVRVCTTPLDRIVAEAGFTAWLGKRD